jgi:hypothetical protein
MHIWYNLMYLYTLVCIYVQTQEKAFMKELLDTQLFSGHILGLVSRWLSGELSTGAVDGAGEGGGDRGHHGAATCAGGGGWAEREEGQKRVLQEREGGGARARERERAWEREREVLEKRVKVLEKQNASFIRTLAQVFFLSSLAVRVCVIGVLNPYYWRGGAYEQAAVRQGEEEEEEEERSRAGLCLCHFLPPSFPPFLHHAILSGTLPHPLPAGEGIAYTENSLHATLYYYYYHIAYTENSLHAILSGTLPHPLPSGEGVGSDVLEKNVGGGEEVPEEGWSTPLGSD